ncbi:MAG: hypothetical protein P8186_10670 [Anaerolineae bacterium]
MPDWITHLGTAYLGARATRLSPAGPLGGMVRPFVLGALLPDLTRFSVLLIDFLDWPAVPTFAYLIPFHSLLIVSLLAGAISLLFTKTGHRPWRVFGLIEAGAAFHFLLDDLEGQIGCGSTTFYPFYFGKPLNLWSTEGTFARLLLVAGAVGIGAALVSRSGWPPPPLRLRLRRDKKVYIYSALLVAAALVIPLFTRGWLVAQDAYHLGFFADPPAWEGATVELCFSEIVTADPLTVEEFDTRLPLALDALNSTGRELSVGDWVSLRGVYRAGAIHPTLVVHHQKSSDVLLSALALAAFVILWLPPIVLRWPPIHRRLRRSPRR